MIMKKSLISLPIMGALLFSFSASVLAFGGGLADIHEEAREALQACRAEETREEKRSCMENVKEQYDISYTRKRGGFRASTLSDEAKEALQACHEENEDDKEAKQDCVLQVKEEHGIEKVGFRRGRRGFLRRSLGSLSEEDRTALRAELTACREENDTRAEIRECARNVMESYRN